MLKGLQIPALYSIPMGDLETPTCLLSTVVHRNFEDIEQKMSDQTKPHDYTTCMCDRCSFFKDELKHYQITPQKVINMATKERYHNDESVREKVLNNSRMRRILSRDIVKDSYKRASFIRTNVNDYDRDLVKKYMTKIGTTIPGFKPDPETDNS